MHEYDQINTSDSEFSPRDETISVPSLADSKEL